MKTIILTMFLYCVGQQINAQDIYYVDGTAGSSTSDGLSWTNAFNNLDLALNLAKYNDIIRVSEGTYVPPSIGSYILKNGVRIYGGYPDNSVPDFWRNILRNPTNNPTILSGHNTVRINAALDANTIVDGFNITGTSRAINVFVNSDVQGDFIFSNCNISGNSAGLFLFHKGSNITPQFNHCNFHNSSIGAHINSVQNFQNINALFNMCTFEQSTHAVQLNCETGNLRPIFTKCIIKDHSSYAITNGNLGIGSLYANICPPSGTYGHHPIFINCLVHDNNGCLDLSVIASCSNEDDQALTFQNCTIYNNSTNNGTAPYNFVSGTNFDPTPQNPTTYYLTRYLAHFINTISWGNVSNGSLMHFDIATRIKITNSLLESSSSASDGNGSDPMYTLVNPGPSGIIPFGARHVQATVGATHIYNQDPLFVDVNNDNFALTANSPAINNGNSILVPSSLTTDFSGMNRIIGIGVDMGAYEYCPNGIGCTSTTPPHNDYRNTPVVELNIYPNPATDFITIDGISDNAQLTIRDVNGKIVYTQLVSSGSYNISISSLSKGIYIAQITVGEELYTQRLIKQ